MTSTTMHNLGYYLVGMADSAALYFSLSDLLGTFVLLRATAASLAAELSFDCCLRLSFSSFLAALVCEFIVVVGP